MHRLMKSFKYAIQGIRFYLNSGENVRIHFTATILVLVLGFWLKLHLSEWALLILAISIVHITEAINTAIELLVDLISPEHNIRAGKIKDIAAGATLLAAITSALIGCILFTPLLLEKLF